jgi:predicted small lipoprotein YifL
MYRSPQHTHRAEMRALLVSVALAVCLAAGAAACGSGDLVFPGDVPATPTSANTATPVPEEN